MPHLPGALFGPYEILGSLGAGGMGEVYKAKDTRLDRIVAVKVSKEAFEDRFRNEALAIAALNHPHIATLFDVGPDYLVMEHVEGKPLRGPLRVAEALSLAGQIADALEHAHRHGVIHRDLKPSNILITKSGVKVLDFGLAKRVSPRRASDESGSTVGDAGAFVGTPRYMAPEQIDGKGADERTDVFAFGLVLYEMLTGQHAFEGTSVPSVMAAILEREPKAISDLRPDTPPAVVQVVETCLAKDPADRWQSVRELKHALAWASRADAHRPARRGRSWTMGAATLAALVVIGSGVALWQRLAPAPRPRPIRLQVPLPPRALMPPMTTFAVSPDGQRIALTLTNPDSDSPPRIFVRALDALTPTALPGSERGWGPFWSPDGRQVAFWSIQRGLQKVDLAGGPAQVVCRECLGAAGGVEYGSTWGRSGVIVYSDAGKLFRVAASGGEPEPLGALVPGETARYWPHFLPDGRHYIYLSLAARREDQGIYVGALDSDLRKRLVAAEHTAAYSPPGYLVYIKERALVAQPFDASRLELSGEPAPILDEEVARLSGATLAAPAFFSVSANGVLSWRPAFGPDRQLTWFDREGRKVGTVGEPAPQGLDDLSPDEKTVAVCRAASPTDRDIWLVDVASGGSRRLTFDPHDDCGATFSPDGKTILFFSDRRGVRELYRKPADGSGEEKLLLASRGFGFDPEDWSADGRFVVYKSTTPGQGQDIFVLPLAEGETAVPVPFLATPASELFPTLSPNGRYMTYQSNESGQPNVYVREFAKTGHPGPGRWQITSGRGLFPLWRPDGKELFFFGGVGLMAVDVQIDGPTFRAGVPKPLGVGMAESGGPRYYATRDGQRFLFAAPVVPREPVRVLVNWLPPER